MLGRNVIFFLEGPDGIESGSKRGKTTEMFELIPAAEVAWQHCRAQ